DQFSQPISPAPALTWAVSGGGTVDATGLFAAGTASGGPYSVTATAAGKTGTAMVTVSVGNPPTVAQPATAATSSVQGKTVALTVLGADDGGEPALLYTWSATTAPAQPTFSVNGSNAAKSTTATFSKAGAYVLEVQIKDGSG